MSESPSDRGYLYRRSSLGMARFGPPPEVLEARRLKALEEIAEFAEDHERHERARKLSAWAAQFAQPSR